MMYWSSSSSQPLLAPLARESVREREREIEPSRTHRRMRYAAHVVFILVRNLLPSFVGTSTRKDQDEVATSNRNKHLDGLRGIASLIVCNCHFLSDYYIARLEHVYGAEGQSNFFQLPVVRLIYTGLPMPYIFFVLSGYVLTRKPLQLSHEGSPERILLNLTSNCFRRWMRLFLPCIAIYLIVIVQILAGLNSGLAYAIKPNDHTDPAPLQTLFEALMFAATDFVKLSNPFTWQRYASVVDYPLWTIPAEFRCSISVFILVLALWNVKPAWRVAAFIPSLMIYALLLAHPDFAAFCAGMIIAELSILQERKLRDLPSLHATQVGTDNAAATMSAPLNRFRWSKLELLDAGHQGGWALVLLAALYLLSFPQRAASETPGYQLLAHLTPSSYRPSTSPLHWYYDGCEFWYVIAASLLILAVEHLPWVQRFLSTAVVQYFGHISFSLYLVHLLWLRTLGEYLVKTLRNKIGASGEAGGHKDLVAVLGAGLITLPFIIYTADLMWRFVDKPSVRLARRLERFVRNSNSVPY
ncbi:hypothetical protein MMC12_005181 [Toensbergia leucococca]|nr:hypothetical protein [Toensbergia leucococca]